MAESAISTRASLRPTRALAYGIVFSLGAALALRRLTRRWRLRARRHARAVLLAEVSEAVGRWEEPCLREVEERLREVEKSAATAGRLFGGNRAAPFYGALRSVAYAPGLELRQMISLWRVGRHLCADLPEDKLWLERMGYIIRYVVFRRLSLMAEARYYYAVWRRALYNFRSVSASDDHAMSQCPSTPVWLKHRRPFWLVPYSVCGKGKLFFLPLSYFPVESILTCTAEETWIKEIVDLIPSLMPQADSSGFIPYLVKTYFSVDCSRNLIKKRYPPSWCRLWNEIDRLFVQHGVPLAKEQLAIREASCKRFYREKIFGDIALVSGVGPDMDIEDLGKDIETVDGCYVLRRSPGASRKMKWLLGLRSLIHALRLGIGLLTPQYNAFAEWMLFSTMSSVSDDTQLDGILTQYALYVLRAALATTTTAILFSFDDTVKSKICDLLRQELTHELCVKLSVADEAFMQRFMEKGIHGRGNPIESTFMNAENVASQMLMHFDYEIRKYLARVFVLGVGLWRREIDLALFAWIVARFDYFDIAHNLSCYCGITVERKLNHDIMSLTDKPLPCLPRYGLQLVMDLLVTDQELCKRSSVSCLSIIVCAGVSVLDWPVLSDAKDPIFQKKKYAYLLSVQSFFDYTVDSVESYLACSRRMNEKVLVMSLLQNALCIRDIVLKDALQSCRNEIEKLIGSRKKLHTSLFGDDFKFTTTFTEKTRRVHPILDEEENDLLFHPSVSKHVPYSLTFEDVFDKHPRFILCQLGLETIFAYKAAMGAQQTNRISAADALVDLVSSPVNNLFGQIFIRLMEFTEKVLLHALLVKRKKWHIVSFLASDLHGDTQLVGWGIITQLGRISSYRTLLKDSEDVSFGPPFRLVQQLARYLPTTLHDASPFQYAPCLVERRMAWKLTLQERSGLIFDDVGRITGGFFPLRNCIEFKGLNFVYPQLHHSVDNGSLLPTLADINLKFFAGKLTAIIGPTGSGKSTILKLINRMYDPVVLLPDISDDFFSSNDKDVDVRLAHLYLKSYFFHPGERTTSNSILLDGIPIWCFSTSYIRKTFGLLEQNPCIVRGLSFRQNIALFNPFVSDEMITESAKLSQCLDFIHASPLGLGTSAGGLSAGEVQRLALARTLVRFLESSKKSARAVPGVMLLDEPAGRLDGHNEACVHAAMAELYSTKGFTVITVSHRLAAFHVATHAVVIQGGRVEYNGDFNNIHASSVFFQSQALLQELSE